MQNGFNIHDLHLPRDWRDTKYNTITRKHFVEVFKILRRINEFLHDP